MTEIKYKILDVKNRAEFREWLTVNSCLEKECWIDVKSGKPEPEGSETEDDLHRMPSFRDSRL